MKKPIIYTVGHSNHSIEKFIDMLQAHNIEEIVDVRSIPKSRHNPQFSQDNLKVSLEKVDINYKHLKQLGGLRRTVKESLNLAWHNTSFRGYADYMSSEEFEEGLETLVNIARSKTVAVMCAEAVPWRCHRSLISDALIKKKWLVLDIFSSTSVKEHRLTSFLKVKKGKIIYPLTKI